MIPASELHHSVKQPERSPDVKQSRLPFWKRWPGQLVRFGLVGGLNTALDLLILNILLWLFPTSNTLAVLFINVTAYCVGAVNSFFVNKYWTFERLQKITLHEVKRFAITTLLGLVCNTTIVWLVTSVFHPLIANTVLWVNASKVVAIAGTVFISYLGMRLWVFVRPAQSNSSLSSSGRRAVNTNVLAESWAYMARAGESSASQIQTVSSETPSEPWGYIDSPEVRTQPGMRIWSLDAPSQFWVRTVTSRIVTLPGICTLESDEDFPSQFISQKAEVPDMIRHTSSQSNAYTSLAPVAHSLCVVLPAYNEEQVIADTVSDVLSVLGEWVRDFEIIVVDDGSKDHTASVVSTISTQDRRVRLVSHGVNQGYGAALVSGFAAASKELTFFMDSDGQFDIRDLEQFFSLIDTYDAVLGYRIDRSDPWMRKLNAWGWKSLVGLVLGIHVRDIDCAFKLLRTSFLHDHPLETRGAMINAELLYKLNQAGCSYTEVGVHHLPRRSGKATGANPVVIARAFRELFVYAREWRRERSHTI